MRTIFLITLALFTFSANGQKLNKLPEINELPLTLNPVIFDPNQDSTISFIEFLQDTTSGVQYPEKIYAVINKKENTEQVFGIGFIGDYRIDDKNISVIIRIHHKNGEISTFTYHEKIDKLSFYDDFEWAMYSPDVEVIYDEEEGILGM